MNKNIGIAEMTAHDLIYLITTLDAMIRTLEVYNDDELPRLQRITKIFDNICKECTGISVLEEIKERREKQTDAQV